jgi:dipeptidase D
MNVRDLEPKELWGNFEDLNAVPRPSKKEERIISFVKSFGEKLGLPTYVDQVGNVIITKPATPGMENRKTVILQSHIDMVHQKNASTVFDFDTMGIQSYVDGEWVKAKGTTLGADNGMGAAAALSLLAAKDIPHPSIEALFTIDEETGMTGAFNLEKNVLKGEILLNLDTEDDDEFSIGCAGGIDTNTSYSCELEIIQDNERMFDIVVKGLKGGHSGMDIHLERGNANKIMNRLMREGKSYDLRIISINGGSLRNAIPRESFATVVASSEDYLNAFKVVANQIKQEYSISDAGLCIEIVPSTNNNSNTAISLSDTNKIIQSIAAVQNGVYRMSSSISGLVETSSSLARVSVFGDSFTTQSLQRSSSESSKMDIAHSIGAVFELMGCNVEHTGSYPGWQPNPNSEMLDVMDKVYKELFNEDPKIKACHAGLECGILNERYPGLDMVSFGPTIRNPHSPDEKVNIASVQKFWNFFQQVLLHTPIRN